MKHFLKDTTGSACIWAAFMIIILFTLSFVIYSGIMVYTKYQTCETELERAATITVDQSMVNVSVRDINLDIPTSSAETLLKSNLIQAGWTQEDDHWVKLKGEKYIYSLEDMIVEIEGKTMGISGVFVMSLPWNIGDIGEIRIPMNMKTSILYIE